MRWTLVTNAKRMSLDQRELRDLGSGVGVGVGEGAVIAGGFAVNVAVEKPVR
jgi:hypothetical protein